VNRYWDEFVAVALGDGRVLVLGGIGRDDASTASAYLYDPAADTWLETGSMTRPRTHPAAAVLADGRVLVVGGYRYAQETGRVPAGGAVLASWASPNQPDRDRVGTLDSGPGPIQGRALATAEIYDPATGEWTTTGPMRFARTGPSVVTLADGRVLVAGSANDNVHIDDLAYRTAEIYDPGTNRFATTDSLPKLDRDAIERRGVKLPVFDPYPAEIGSLTALPDGGALLVGYQHSWKMAAGVVQSFRLLGADHTWRRLGEPFAWNGAEPASNREGCVLGAATAALADGSVLLAGGSSCGIWSWDEDDWMRDDVLRYEPRAGAWSPLPKLPQRRSYSIGALLADGSVMVAAGLTWVGGDARSEWARTTYRFVGTD
jgi:hypothetical protein